jgi:hypothetical protein
MEQPLALRILRSLVIAILVLAPGLASKADDGWVATFPSSPGPKVEELKKRICALESTGTINSEQASQLRNEMQQIQKLRTLFRTAVEDLALWENMLLNRDLDHVSAKLDQACKEARPGSTPVVSSADTSRAFDNWLHTGAPGSSQLKVDAGMKAAPSEAPDMVP